MMYNDFGQQYSFLTTCSKGSRLDYREKHAGKVERWADSRLCYIQDYIQDCIAEWWRRSAGHSSDLADSSQVGKGPAIEKASKICIRNI